MVGATWGTGQVLLDILWFFLFVVEVWLMITIFIDIFRRHDMKGWLKAFWVLFVFVVPLVGILLYLIIYGDEMKVHAQQALQEQDKMFREYVRQAGGSYSAADELSRLAELKANGTINDEEFERLKSKIVNA
jgi:archaellum biogenesis protein FlaJ (TadC family)